MTDEQNSEDSPRTGSERTEAREIAKRAMEQARASARKRGTNPRSARQSAKDRVARQEVSGVARTPFGKGREPRALGAEVAAIFQRMGWTEQIEVASVIARWREAVGDQIADKCEPLGFDEGVLTLRAATTAWATQLSLMAPELRQKLNEQIGRNIVTEITVVGPTQRSWKKGPRSVKGPGPRDTYG